LCSHSQVDRSDVTQKPTCGEVGRVIPSSDSTLNTQSASSYGGRPKSMTKLASRKLEESVDKCMQEAAEDYSNVRKRL